MSCFTHDSLLQTLQVLFGLLMALMQESNRSNGNITVTKKIFWYAEDLNMQYMRGC